MARNGGKTSKQRLQEEIAKAVGAGKPAAVETVDFSDPNRPKTCIEVDFPILPINQIAAIEGNAGKPIYQVSKWWARRRSSVFRAMLLAAAMKAPDDPALAAKSVWDVYYANHQKKGTLKDLKVADVFMGGGTTIVEGSRLGMQMYGVDLNPVAWFIVKNELAQVSPEEVEALLRDIEADVKPQIMPFYACDCPRGHKGKWTRLSTGEVMAGDFDTLSLTPAERKDYQYEGPEIIYVFWAKHGPCQITGCGHRTPIMSSPVMAVKTLTVKAWPAYKCAKCGKIFDVEESEARMAPSVPLVAADSEEPYAVLDGNFGLTCPHCGHHDRFPRLPEKGKKKKIELSLLVHPQWLAGSPKFSPDGMEYGGSATDSPEATTAWDRERASKLRLLEVRGSLPAEVTCPETKVTFRTDKGTVPKKSSYACGHCGVVQDVLETVKASGKTGPVAAYAIQGYCPKCDSEGKLYGGRFFSPALETAPFDAAVREWGYRKDTDLAEFWPKSELPYGFMTHHLNGGIPNHGFTHWWKMFNARQLLTHTQLLRAIVKVGESHHRWEAREFVMSAFQQYLRNQNMFCFWDLAYDKLVPMLSNANFHPKSTVVENCVFAHLGRGNWRSCTEALAKSSEWAFNPWEILATSLAAEKVDISSNGSHGKSIKVFCLDPVQNHQSLECASATGLEDIAPGSYDLVITDPPFGGLVHYSELSDFFSVWLRLVLGCRYPNQFGGEYTPKALEVVSNKARQPDDPDSFYQRLLTESWRECNRILKPGGILAFTFHHNEDAPWVSVLESLFDAGFCLEGTFPIRSDETKGDGEFGSRKVEYDVIHVCRKHMEEPTAISWAKMRREVMRDVLQIASILEHHRKAGLPAADVKVIKRGKALEYYSRHYGKVYVDQDKSLSVKEALVGINQLLDEDSGVVKEPPPVNAEPFTRQFLRLFDGQSDLPRDQMQKFLRGTGIAPEEFKDRGWCIENHKVYYVTSPLEIARDWYGRHRRRLTVDYDQAMVLIGACFDGSGINAGETLRNQHFRPHQALAALLNWHAKHSGGNEIRNAAARALHIYKSWEAQNREQVKQMALFSGEEEE